MWENTWWPRDGRKNAKFNPRPTRPKPDALETKNTSNIQKIELNIFKKFYQKESFEIFKQEKFEDEQLIWYFFVSIPIAHYYNKWVGKYDCISQITF
jgi:hypothetical protein